MRGPVLLAWELGGGLGHIAALAEIARRLSTHGVRLVAALKDLSAATALAKVAVDVLQAPLWPGSLRENTLTLVPRSSATMGDMLADAGLGHETALTQLLKAWIVIFDFVKPSLVVGDFAPGASLAARGRIPLALTGTGYTIPPPHMAAFPALHRMSPPLWREEEVIETVNRSLLTVGAPRLERLPGIFEADAHLVRCFPALDPYRSERQRPADGPLIARLPEWRDPAARGIFVYLSPGTAPPRYLIEALLELAPLLRVFAPALASEDRQALAGRGATLFEAPPPPATELRENCLIVHYGVLGMSHWALLAGVPQLALSLDIEKDLIGAALEELGVGRLVKIHDPAARVTAQGIGDLANDSGFAEKALDVARKLRAEFDPSRSERFVTECLRLAG